jgi:phage portal protein BeeE
VPPHKVFDLSDAHYSNMEQATNEYIDDGVEPICKRMRQQFERTLFFEDELDTYCLEDDYSVLQRGDRKSRFDTYASAVTNGILCVNECRAMEGLNPVEGGDVYRRPLNTGDAGGNPKSSVAAERTEAAPPPAERPPQPTVPEPDTKPLENL